MGATLDWGRHYLMVEPEHFRVDYAINPFMDLAYQPDPAATRDQWDAIAAAIIDAGGAVDVLAQRRTRIELAVEQGPAELVGDAIDGADRLDVEAREGVPGCPVLGLLSLGSLGHLPMIVRQKLRHGRPARTI